MFPDDDVYGKQSRLMFELHALMHTARRYMDRLAETQGGPRPGGGRGISGANLMIIAYLYQNRDRDVFQKDLEEDLNVRRSTVSKVVQMMEEKGMIRREQVARDGRLRKLVLTRTTLDGIEAFMANSRRAESRMTQNFTEEELDQFFRLLNKARQNLKDD